MQIKDKRVIVTGAAGGLGMTISRELLRNGASVSTFVIFLIIEKLSERVTCSFDFHKYEENQVFSEFSMIIDSKVVDIKKKTKTLAIQFTRFTILSYGLSFFSKTLQ